MRFQFSILTMLVCTAALAVALAYSASTHVHVQEFDPVGSLTADYIRLPVAAEIALRMAWAGPLAVFVSLCLVSALRRFATRMKASRPIPAPAEHPLSDSLPDASAARFRFSIRDLLWLTVVVALVVGWWVERRQLVAAIRQLIEATQEIQVTYGIDSAADRQEILKTLQEAYADVPSVQLIDDPAGRILIGATHGEHIAIRIALRALEKQRKMNRQMPDSVASPEANSDAD